MNDVEMQIAIARLTTVLESGMSHMNRRMDDAQATTRQQHVENMDRLERIEAEVRKTNGRVTRLEEQVRTLFRKVKEKADVLGERTGITRRDVTVFVCGGGGLMAAWKFAEWAFHQLKALP